MAEFLYVVRPSRPEMLSDGPALGEAEALSAHAGYLQRLPDQGVLEMAGRTQTSDARTFGMVIFHAPDEETAREIMRADPAVDRGVMVAEFFPYRVAFKGGSAAATDR